MKRMISLLAGLACAAPVMAQPDGLVYAFDLRGVNEFFTFDPSNAAGGATLIDNFNVNQYDTFAIGFSVDRNTLWAVTFPALELGTIDLATGAFTATTILSGDVVSGLDNVGGISFDPNGTVYINTGTDLLTLDINTGVATFVGPFNSFGLMIDIAIDSQGNMYGMDISDDSLYSIDKTTGAATIVGVSHGLAANFAQGMDFDWSDDVLYGAIYTGGGTGQWCSYNLADGTVNQLFNTTAFGSDFGGAEMEVAIRSVAGGGPVCIGDIADDNGNLGADGMVSFGDFLALLGLLGPCPGGTPGCTGDIADDNGNLGGDGMVSFGDFLALLGLLGPCP